MTDIGKFALMMAVIIAGYTVLAAVIGARGKKDRLVQSAMFASLALLGLLTIAMAALVYAFLTRDFELAYVANYSNRALPVLYTLSAVWGGQAGSLLFWAWLLALFNAIVVLQNRRQNRVLLPYVVAIQTGVTLVFLILIVFVSSPFARLVITPADGYGLNPLLQNPGMLFHPPTLLIGYVGFTVPFAFAIAAMITGQLGDIWIRTTRRWTLFSWFFLGIGVFLGAKWAYVELGWGGFWAWDPVENASLMPWLTATAYLHSVMIQERKNMLKVWNLVLIILTFLLCIFGTFITRSGIISSVHSFGQSALGPFFLAFILLVFVGAAILLRARMPLLKSTNELDSLISRESSFLLNNLLLVGAAFAVFLGTMFPIISEAVRGVKITVGPPYFNSVMVPIGLVLLLITGICPLIAWRRATARNFRQNLLAPLIVALAGSLGLIIAGMRHVYALLTFGIAIFVTATLILEFFKGARARHALKKESYPVALARLIWGNKRRYGGYIVHFGIVLMFLGMAASTAFKSSQEIHLKKGEQTQLNDYTITFEGLSQYPTANKQVTAATLSIRRQGRQIGYLNPAVEIYEGGDGTTATDVAIRSNLREDLYTILAGYNLEEDTATLKLIVQPLVSWIWIGGWVLAAGTVLVMLPDRRERRRFAVKYAQEALKQ